MPININGTTGISGVDGSAGTPGIQGSDTNTGIFFPAADTIAFTEGGIERMRLDSSGRLGFPGAASTYGAVTIYGQKNGWSGINFNSSAGVNVGTLMMADGFGGFFNTADNAWLGYFNTSGLVLGSATLINPTGSAPMYTCRAWVNFNGTGTVAIRASGNVSSITDNGTGDYTVNFTTAMQDADYSVVISNTVTAGYAAVVVGNIAANRTGAVVQAPTTSNVRSSFVIPATGAAADVAYLCVSIFR